MASSEVAIGNSGRLLLDLAFGHLSQQVFARGDVLHDLSHRPFENRRLEAPLRFGQTARRVNDVLLSSFEILEPAVEVGLRERLRARAIEDHEQRCQCYAKYSLHDSCHLLVSIRVPELYIALL